MPILRLIVEVDERGTTTAAITTSAITDVRSSWAGVRRRLRFHTLTAFVKEDTPLSGDREVQNFPKNVPGSSLAGRDKAQTHNPLILTEVKEARALLGGCMTWSSRRDNHQFLRTTGRRLLLRVMDNEGAHAYRPLEHLKRVRRQGGEAAVRLQQIQFQGSLAKDSRPEAI